LKKIEKFRPANFIEKNLLIFIAPISFSGLFWDWCLMNL